TSSFPPVCCGYRRVQVHPLSGWPARWLLGWPVRWLSCWLVYWSLRLLAHLLANWPAHPERRPARSAAAIRPNHISGACLASLDAVKFGRKSRGRAMEGQALSVAICITIATYCGVATLTPSYQQAGKASDRPVGCA